MTDRFKAQQGYVTFAQNNADTDYLRLAYAQALSIKCTQKINNYAVIVDAETEKLITDEHRKVFDHVIVLTDDGSIDDKWKMRNEWKVWWLTPFKETIKVESDMLFSTSIDHWWAGMQHREVCLTTKIRDYESNISNSRRYRKLFDDNKLPDVYNGLMYFRYGQISMDFFTTARSIFMNWKYVKETVLANCRDDEPTTDVVYALAALIIGEEKCVVPTLSYPTFVHMKGAINNLPADADWTKKFYGQLDDKCNLTIGFNRQQYPVHYYQKSFITDQIIKTYEQRYRTSVIGGA